VQDININRNVAGGGINLAQRVMDCADAGHILLSRTAAEVLRELSAWESSIHDLGEVEVKHGVRVHIYNFYTADHGNAQIPSKVAAARRATVRPRELLANLAGTAGWLRAHWQLTGALAVLMMNPTLLAQVGRRLGTDFILSGTYLPMGKPGELRVEVNLHEVRTGRTVVSLPVQGSEQQPLELVARVAVQLRAKCGAGFVSARELAAASAAMSSIPQATRLYAEGLDRLRVFDALGAQTLLEKAVAADDSFSLAHSALAEAYHRLGWDFKAMEQAKRGFERTQKLSQEGRFLAEARYREYSSDWNKAIELYRTLYTFFPDALDYGLKLGEVQVMAGRPRDAQKTVESLRKAQRGTDPD
jgi:hypothetical protein